MNLGALPREHSLHGSPKGARESLNTVLKILPHAVSMLKGEGHSK